MSTLVVRFSSLGDVVLTGSVTGGLAPVHFLTRRAYADVAAVLPGVTDVLVWEDGPRIPAVDRVVDLHASPRSRWALAASRAPVRRVRRHDLRRRLRVAFKTLPPPTVIERYAEAAGVPPAPRPWIAVDGPRDALVLCPGAHHETKRWSAARFAELGRRWPGPVVVLGGPGDEPLVRDVADGIGHRAEVAGPAWPSVRVALGRGRLAVAGDSGLLHLCGAVGMPVVGLFGPTTSADGFWCHEGVALELPLFCRPCSRYGGAVCPIGDHRCLVDLGVEEVWAELERLS